jgi:hypothetical protein
MTLFVKSTNVIKNVAINGLKLKIIKAQGLPVKAFLLTECQKFEIG